MSDNSNFVRGEKRWLERGRVLEGVVNRLVVAKDTGIGDTTVSTFKINYLEFWARITGACCRREDKEGQEDKEEAEYKVNHI